MVLGEDLFGLLWISFVLRERVLKQEIKEQEERKNREYCLEKLLAGSS